MGGTYSFRVDGIIIDYRAVRGMESRSLRSLQRTRLGIPLKFCKLRAAGNSFTAADKVPKGSSR